MQRTVALLRQLSGCESAATSSVARAFSTASPFSFSSVQDAPSSSLSSAINVSAKPAAGGKTVEVSVRAGGAAANAKYPVAALRKLAAKEIALVDAARVSVLHASLTDYLLRLSHERYNVLAQYPDFTTMYGKDYFYRAHPEDLKSFYAAADEFHRMWDVVTEFDSLSSLSQDLMPGYLRKRLSVIHPAAGPTSGNGALTTFLLSQA